MPTGCRDLSRLAAAGTWLVPRAGSDVESLNI